MRFTFDEKEMKVSREEFIKKHHHIAPEVAGKLWDKYNVKPVTVKEAKVKDDK